MGQVSEGFYLSSSAFLIREERSSRSFPNVRRAENKIRPRQQPGWSTMSSGESSHLTLNKECARIPELLESNKVWVAPIFFEVFFKMARLP